MAGRVESSPVAAGYGAYSASGVFFNLVRTVWCPPVRAEIHIYAIQFRLLDKHSHRRHPR